MPIRRVQCPAKPLLSLSAVVALFWAGLSSANVPFFFSTGNPDGLMATHSRPESVGKFEIQSADDLTLGSATKRTGATFAGLLTGGATTADIGEVRVDPDRQRFGTDTVGAGAFNAAFSLTGTASEPGTVLLIGAGLVALWWRLRTRTLRKRTAARRLASISRARMRALLPTRATAKLGAVERRQGSAGRISPRTSPKPTR
ncbi:MAG TPA: PEP-CTERM sorting domain-containing protein [Casimicrobiaceae bacterium]